MIEINVNTYTIYDWQWFLLMIIYICKQKNVDEEK